MKNFYVYVVGAFFLGTLVLGISAFVSDNSFEDVFAEEDSDTPPHECFIGPCTNHNHCGPGSECGCIGGACGWVNGSSVKDNPA